MGKSILVESEFKNNIVYILDCLKSGELQTGKNLFEGLPWGNGMPPCDYNKITSHKELGEALDRIKKEAENGLCPIIHIEAHGNRIEGIFIGQETENMSWEELCGHLRKINVLTGNNTGVFVAACFGYYGIRGLNFKEPAPFYFLIGSQKEETAGTFDDKMSIFYQALFETNAIDKAMEKVSDSLEIFYSEKAFVILMARYFKEKCMGKGKRGRLESLLTEIGKNDINRTPERMRLQRKELKKLIKPGESIYNQFCKRFLMGKSPLPYEKIVSFLAER
jgi:hypothetical protein